MMPMTKAIRLVIWAAILAGFVSARAASAQPGAQSAAHGKQLFMGDNCYLCHGTVGQGGAGPTLAPPRLMPQPGFAAYATS
jgi:mono/diheme cytochrome c family protein